MCRPSCCKPSQGGSGIAAVAVLAGAVFLAANIGPAVAKLWHIAVEVLTIVTLTAATAAACTLVIWATARIIAARRNPRGIERLRQHPTDAQPIIWLVRPLAAERSRADQAQMLIRSLHTSLVPPVPPGLEPRELTPAPIKARRP